GSFGDMACFSFLSNKTITTGEGGMVVTSSDHYAEQLRYLRNLAFGPKRFLHEDAGYNFRLSSIQAGFGLAQLDRLEEVLAQKIDLYERYAERLKSNPAIQLPVLPEVGRHGQWMVAIRIDQSVCPMKNQDVMAKLSEAGVDSRSFFCPMNQQPFLDVDPAHRECPVADAMWEDGLYLPSTTSLTNDDLDEICGELNSILSS
ncbi:MAG: DegT/DnrJ/EryC1/StrS family aminotransferase, partial [Verrucomicrobiota bacterium]